jgi:nucleotide-binding universal stress UspA family protein
MSPAIAAAPAALKLSHILAPVDFSDPCRRSAETAGELARHFGASVTLLHAAPLMTLALGIPEALAYAPNPEFADLEVEERSALLASFAPAAGPDARRVVVEKQPARAILDYANAHGCDLIVMPTHGYRALHRLIVGSVTTEVLRAAPCPVWTGAHYERPIPGAFQSVLCAVDLEKQSPAVLRWAAAFARAYGASLEVIHGLPMSAVRAGGVYFDPQWHITLAHDARQRIEALLRDAGSEAAISIELGDMPGAVIAKARETPSGLLVIGRGPHAYSIIREAPGPVVAV